MNKNDWLGADSSQIDLFIHMGEIVVRELYDVSVIMLYYSGLLILLWIVVQ
nr:hypothetical protein [uncultured Amphritea sp.]